MAPGATNLGDNRFALLSPSPRAKRKKNQAENLTTEFPELPVTKKDDPKFIIVKAKDPKKNLSSYSIFAVHKSLLAICRDVNKIIPASDGSLILLLKNQANAKKFLDAKTLPGICEITAKYHEGLNSIKGTVYAPFLNNVPETEIVEGLKEYNVINAYKFQRTTDGTLKPTGVILLTFDSYYLPDKINIAWINTSVRPYYPNPMRCKICQRIGHTQKHCKGMPACISCNLPPHAPEPCSRIYCANCAGDHTATFNSCPKYLQAKEVLIIKTQEKCSIREANKIYKSRNPIQVSSTSYASVTSKSNVPEEKKKIVKQNTNIPSIITKNNTENLQSTKETKTNTSQQKQHHNHISSTITQNTCLPANETYRTSSANYEHSSPTISPNYTTCETSTKSTMQIDTFLQQQSNTTIHSRASSAIPSNNIPVTPPTIPTSEEYLDKATTLNKDQNFTSFTQ